MSTSQPNLKPVRKKTMAQQLWFLHWLMAAFYLLLFMTGRYRNMLPRGSDNRELVNDLHQTLGAVVMSLLLARIFVLLLVLQHKYRRRQPKRTWDWMQMVALHSTLYILMLIVPLSGYLATNGNGHEVVVFGTGITLPRLLPDNEPVGHFLGHAHFWLAYTMLAFTVIHAFDQRKYLNAQLRRFSKALRKAISPKN